MLTVIMGSSSLALTKLGPTDPNRELVTEIYGAGERAASLTRQILAFSRRQRLKPQLVRLNHIVSNMQPFLCRVLGEDVELRLCLAPDLMQTEVDPQQMEQVLMNLAVNARHAMPNGGGLLIETRNAQLEGIRSPAHPEVHSGDYVMVTVADSGCGMDEETKCRVFEPFFTTRELGEGTGLGLSTVYGIVTQSGGSITVESEPGRGSCFRICLPAAAGAAAAEVVGPQFV